MKAHPTNNKGHPRSAFAEQSLVGATDPTNHNLVQKPQVLIDYERYAAMLEHPDLSEAQKNAFIDCLWNLITEIIYLGVEVLSDNTSHEDKFQNILDHLPDDMVDSNIAQSSNKPQHSSS